MIKLNRLARFLAVAALLAVLPAELTARTRKGDRLLKEGQQAELRDEWDSALASYEEALAEDPGDTGYQMAARRARFQAGMVHVANGQKLREEGQLEEALSEFQRAFAIDPSSSIAEQELVYTFRMIRLREQEGEEPDEEPALSPFEQSRRDAEERIDRLRGVPDLQPISTLLNTLRMNNQPVDVLYETVGKLAGINVVMDPQFQATGGNNFDVDLTNATLQDALDYLAMLTTTYWKPLTENTIFVTNDNVTKRRDYEEVVVKVFYMKNITKVQELQEIVASVRSVTDIRRMFTYNSQNAIIVRATRDQMMLAEKLFHDLDKPLAEVVVDVIVMEASSVRTRDLASSIMSGASNGLSLPISYTGGIAPSDGTDVVSAGPVALGGLRYLNGNDWAVTVPNALLEAIMTDTGSKVLQRPQVRAADNQPASLRLGDRIPYATGSYSPGVGGAGVGVSPLVSTQFQYAEIGVNVDLTPKVHGNDEVSLHIELEISTDRGRVDLGGIEQPIFGQRRVVEDIRVKSGEVTLLGGLTQDQTTRSLSGVPGLARIPILKWLGFASEGKETNQGELLIALIPHIVRRPEYTEANLRAIAAGNDQVVSLSYDWNHDAEEVEEETGPAATVAPTSAAEPAAPPMTAPPAPEVTAPESPAPQLAPAALRFDPQVVTTQQGGVFRVSVMVDNATDVFRAPIRFQFDPALLRVNEIERGSFLAGDGQQVIFTRNILNDSGEASVVLNRLPGSQGMSGSGTLVTLTMQAVGQGGETELRLPDLIIRDSQMEEIPVTAPSLRVQIE